MKTYLVAITLVLGFGGSLLLAYFGLSLWQPATILQGMTLLVAAFFTAAFTAFTTSWATAKSRLRA